MSDTSNEARLKRLLKRPQFADEVVIRERVAVWKITWGDEAGWEVPYVTSNDPATGAGKTCEHNTSLEISGTSTTDTQGKAQFRVSDIWCHEWFSGFAGRLAFDFPIVCVATAQTAKPVFMTSVQQRVGPPSAGGIDNDIQIEVFSWGPTGSPQGNIVFDWHCKVPLTWWSVFRGPQRTARGTQPAASPPACPHCGA